MDLAGIAVTAGGAAVLAASVAGASHDTIHPAEQRAFRAINGLPDWLYGVLWLPMQLGNLVVGALAGLLVAWWVGSWGTAIAVVVATGAKLVTERLIRRRVGAFLEVRQRPGTSQPVVRRRGDDVPESGPSFPSGHVILAAAIAVVVTPEVPVAVWWVPLTLALLVAVGRVYVGAHNPLDVTAGFGAGMAIGGALLLVLP